MTKKRFILFISIMIFSLFLTIRNRNVYEFRQDIIVLIQNYNEQHYYNGSIRKLNEIIPEYNKMLFSLKPLEYKYWISEKNMKKLTQRTDILI